MKKPSLTIPFGKSPKVLFLGNGINRAFGFLSWDGLINTKTENKSLELDGIPYPMQAVILTNDCVDRYMNDISDELCHIKSCDEEEELLRGVSQLPIDTILTTNYTYEFEKAIFENFKVVPQKASKYRKYAVDKSSEFAKRQLHAYFSLPNIDIPIWHIHGESARPDTMILGHYYYGKLLSSMQNYLSSVISRYKYCVKHELDFECKSWIDYFLVGNVIMVGFGLDLSEFDLWWLINAKKRHFPQTNVIIYKPDAKNSEKLLAKAYGVEIITDGYSGCYKEYYSKLIFDTLK